MVGTGFSYMRHRFFVVPCVVVWFGAAGRRSWLSIQQVRAFEAESPQTAQPTRETPFKRLWSLQIRLDPCLYITIFEPPLPALLLKGWRDCAVASRPFP